MKRFQTNDLIGDYRILSFLGVGGMGEVYHAVHYKLNRSVAMKVLSGNSDSYEVFKTRFFNEARLQANLNHPNIVTLYDFQEINGQLYIFMEYIEGECLNELIERQIWSVEDSLKIFATIVETVAYIHSQGVIHRDIKPQNVKVTFNQVVKLLDFGIAKDSLTSDVTKTGGLVGTPNYVAPEQLQGKLASKSTDIWALGVLLYKMVTTKVPFDSDNFANLFMRITNNEYLPPEQVNRAVPQSVARIIKKCLAHDPKNRYESAEELFQEVQKVINHQYGRMAETRIGAVDSVNNEMESSGQIISVPEKRVSYPFIAAVSTLAVILIFGFVGVIVWAISNSETPVVSNNRNISQNGNRKIVPEAKNSPIAVTRTDEVKNQTDQVKKSRIIQIDTIEGKAKILRNNEIVGETPFDIEVKDGDQFYLTLQRDGFEDKSVQIEVTPNKQVYTFSLKPR